MESRLKDRTAHNGFALLLSLLLLPSTLGFALLGPFQPWQTPALGYNLYGWDIAGPMELDEEYRWNIPIITYGVDRAFIDFFGQPGVEAVQSAIRIINDLPPSSQIDLAAFPTDSRGLNVRAQSEELIDVKSAILALVIEQLGLAPPERNVWALRGRQILGGTPEAPLLWTNYLVLNRNFDPVSLDPSPWVYEGGLTYKILE
jgi:hypothetical protein